MSKAAATRVLIGCRAKRLEQLVRHAGSAVAFVNGLKILETERRPSTGYISQLICGHSSFGEKAARKLERMAGVHAGYLEHEATGESTVKAVLSCNPRIDVKIENGFMVIRIPMEKT